MAKSVPDDRIGEALHKKSLSKKLVVRAAVWSLMRSGRSPTECLWIANHVQKHALPWGSEEEYGDALDFAFKIMEIEKNPKTKP